MDNNEAVNNGSSIMSPLEIEEETISLFDEVNGRAPNLRKRPALKVSLMANLDQLNTGSGFRGLLRTKTAFAIRNAVLLGLLAWMAFMFVDAMYGTIENLDMVEEDPRGIHQSSFGGKNNPNSVAGINQKHEMPDWHHLNLIPDKDNVGQTVTSVSVENRMNHVGHYWHDPHMSVYASPLYKDPTDEQLDKEQQDFLKLMNETKKKFGAWDLVDPYYDQKKDYRPKPNWEACTNRDCPTGDFNADVWQLDEDYVGAMIDQAKQLISRVKEAMYEEYGHGSYKPDGTKFSEAELEDRSKIFQVLVGDDLKVNDQNIAIDTGTNQPALGVAHFTSKAWEALVRKLLHALVTNDYFFVVTVGDGKAAGHGNNFVQSPIMQFHYLVEPVLDFLGIRLISRNMATKDASVVFQAMGGADFMGEVDLLWFDSSTRQESEGVQDLLYKQTILSGERVPVILTNRALNADTAWIGNLQPNDKICGNKKDGVCDLNIHNSVCWIPRVSVEPQVKQDSSVPAEHYPGRYAHQLEARKLSFVILHALDAALNQWVDGIEAEGFPLQDSYWHVSERYDTLREMIRNMATGKSPCETLLGDLASLCHMELHGNTEWTPRITPYANSLRALVPSLMDVGNYFVEELYVEVDLWPPQWKIPATQVDPHLAAIATSAPPPIDYDNGYFFDDDIAWVDFDDDALINGDFDGGRQRRDLEAIESQALGGQEAERHTAESTSLHRSIRVRRLFDAGDSLPGGKGWTVYNNVAGFCDGTSQSRCGRDNSSKCLMAGHNDYTNTGLLGDGLSGWLLFRIRNLQEGIVLAHLDVTVPANSNPVTESWAQVNNEGGSGNRRLNLPKDISFDYAINGEIKTLSSTEFEQLGVKITDEMTLYPLYVNTTANVDALDLGIRIRSDEGRAATLLVTHIYYA